MELVLDCETDVVFTGTRKRDKKYMDPYTPGTALVSVGAMALSIIDYDIAQDFPLDIGLGIKTWVFKHDEVPVPDKPDELQALINRADLLVFQNAAYDIPWLIETGFDLGDTPIYDTMLASYVLSRGERKSHSLENLCVEHGLTHKRSDIMQGYYDSHTLMSAVPLDIHLEYLRGDIQSTAELYLKMRALYADDVNKGLQKTLDLANDVCGVLSEIYRNGVRIDRGALQEVKQEYESEKIALTTRLESTAAEVMGDLPYSLTSTEQLSRIIYSRQPRDKATWKKQFSYWMKDGKYKDAIAQHAAPVYRMQADKCSECNGYGKIQKTRKSGELYKLANVCPICKGMRFTYTKTATLAGFKFTPPNSQWVTDDGFSTSKDQLYALSKAAQKRGMHKAQQFLVDVMRLNAINSYLSNFVKGINTNISVSGLLHVSLYQYTTATGRLSGRDPNMQNMPQGRTFPVRKVFRSRWDNGTIMEGDYAQLEFRCAVFQAQDEVGMREIDEGFDVHSYTAECMTTAGEPTERQEAKAHTFKPLYGGTTGTPAQVTYYESFTAKYKGIAAWQDVLCDTALKTKIITLPSGREYRFDARRNSNGSISPRTKIVNYPVQGFATGDIVQLAMVMLSRAMRAAKVKSLLINQVHDSIVADVYPGEEDVMAPLMNSVMSGIIATMKSYWGVDFNVPLTVEIKGGKDWLNTSVIKLEA
jgi:DNA polymerase I-like protein with 3'-5' exonuclease and polymerase domains